MSTGVLELQIHDNADKAAKGLDRLATSLKRVQQALGNGLKLGNTASQIGQLTAALNKAVPEESVARLERLAKAINTLKGASGANIGKLITGTGSGVTASVKQTVQEAVAEGAAKGMEAVGKAKETTKTLTENISTAVTEGFAAMEQRVEEVDEVREKLLEVKDTLHETDQLVNNINVDQVAESTTQSLEKVKQQVQEVNESLEEHRRIRREMFARQEEQRLEKNYPNMRALYLEGMEPFKTNMPNQYGFTPESIERGETYAEALEMTMKEVNKYVDEYMEKIQTPIDTSLRDRIDSTLSFAKDHEGEAFESWKVFRDAGMLDPQGSAGSAVSAVGEAAQRATRPTAALRSRLEELGASLKKMGANGYYTARNTFAALREQTSKLIAPLGKFASQLFKVAKYRFLRGIIKQITEGFKEGIENLYFYSKGVGTDFAPAMDSAASALLQMKNAIGAAAAPAIQMLIPILRQATNVVIQFMNYINQLLALIRGQTTWTQAIPATTNAFEQQTHAAHGAAAAVKDLLADWDELNIIQSETSGGAGGGTSGAATDYLNMFQEVAEFDNRIRKIFDFVNDNLREFATLAAGVGALLMGWNISNSFAQTLPWLAKIGTGLAAAGAIVLTLTLTDLTGKAFVDTGKPGWFLLDALTGAVGSKLAGSLVEKLLGTAAGEVTQGFTLMLSGYVNLRNALGAAAQQKMGEAWMLNALGAIEMGIGAGLVAAGFGAGVTASIATGSVVGLAALTIMIPLLLEAKKKATYRQMAEEAFAKAGEGGLDPQKYLDALQKKLDEMTRGSSLVIDVFAGFDEHSESFKKAAESLKHMTYMVSGDGKLTVKDAEEFKNAWDAVMNEFKEMQKISFATIKSGLEEAAGNGSKAIRDAALEYRKAVVEAEGTINGAVAGLQARMATLEGKMASGLTAEEAEEYERIYKALAGSTESGIETILRTLEQGTNFDFGQENALQNALDFIANMGAETIQPAIDAVNEQYDTEIKALEGRKQQLKMLLDAGVLKKADYDRFMETYNGVAELYKQRQSEQMEQISNATQGAYDAILNGALDGFKNIDKTDSRAVNAYIETVLMPLAQAITAAGGEIPKEVKEALTAPDVDQYITEAINNVKMELNRNPDLFKDEHGNAAEGARNWLIGIIDDANHDLAAYIQENGLNPFDFIKENASELNVGFPKIDTTEFDAQLDSQYQKIRAFVISVNSMLSMIQLGNFANSVRGAVAGTFSPWFSGFSGYGRATGGYVRSGDLVTVNENGNFEMMGRMGNQPVVANNQQIVDGITQGVSNANGSVVGEMRTMVGLMQRMLNKEFTARAVPSSGWGRNNSKSADAYERVTG